LKKTKRKELFKKSNDRARKLLSEIKLLSIAETLEEASRKYLKNCKESIHDNIMFLQGSNFGAKWQQEQDKNKFSDKDSFVNKSLKWWMSLSTEKQVDIAFKYNEPTFNLTLRAIMFEFEQFKKK